VNRRRLIPLVIGVVLLTIGVGLILYGSTLPADFVAISRWNYSNHGEVSVLMLIGIIPVSLGIAFLLFWFLTRSKPASPSS